MVTTTYQPIVLTAAGTQHVKGVYTQVVASTPYASSRLYVTLRSIDAGIRFVLVDLATGAAGVETVIVANLAISTDLDRLSGYFVACDVDVPAGTRLAARCQASTASTQFTLSVLLEDRALASLSAPVTYGADAANSRGTQIDPGAVANTKSAYTQFSASTSARIDALLLCCTSQYVTTAIPAFSTWAIDVATGAAGSETILLSDLICLASTNNDMVRPAFMRLPAAIPAGSRLAIRCACDQTAVNSRVLTITAMGMQEPASGGGSAAGAVAYVG